MRFWKLVIGKQPLSNDERWVYSEWIIRKFQRACNLSSFILIIQTIQAPDFRPSIERKLLKWMENYQWLLLSLHSVTTQRPDSGGGHPRDCGPLLGERDACDRVPDHLCAHGPWRSRAGHASAWRPEAGHHSGAWTWCGIPDQRLCRAQQQEEHSCQREGVNT